MFRKITALTLSALLFASIVAAQPASELTVVDKTAKVEKVIYGTEQTGSLLERVNKLEKDIYGTEVKEALLAKADRLFTYTKETTIDAPSLITRVNAIEWTLTHNQTSDSVKTRIENLEHLLTGVPAIGAIESRLTKLGKLAYTSGQPQVEAVEIPKDMLVKIKLLTPLDTRTSRTGDLVSFQASDDVFVNGLLVIGKGSLGAGKVTKVEGAKNFGRDARLEIDFQSITAIDGTILSTFLGEKAKEETKSLAKAAGATVVGLAVLGPVGIVGGAFVHGQEISIPVGAEMFIQTKELSPIFGLKAK